MLGRIGSGSTVAGVVVGLLAIAVADDRCIEAWICLALIAGIMLVTFAPWIPFVRRVLPSVQRLAALEDFWIEGQNLFRESVHSDAEWTDWEKRHKDWQSRVFALIESRISLVDAGLFVQPVIVVITLAGSFNNDHSLARSAIQHQLQELIRLREAEKPR